MRGRRCFEIAGCLAVLLSIAHQAAGDVFALELKQGDFIRSDSAEPPGSDAAWEPAQLPHVWSDVEPGQRSDAWYRFTLPTVENGRGNFAVYLPNAILNATIYLNGEWLAQCGRISDPLARCWNTPLYAEFPPERLAAEGNLLHVRLAGYAPYARLDPPRYGAAAELHPVYRSRIFAQVGVARAAAAFGAMMLLFMFALWVGTHDPVYGAFAATVFFWEINNLNSFLIEVPFPHWLFEFFVHVAIDWLAAGMVVFAHRYFGVLHRAREAAVFVFVGVSGVATAFSIPSAFHVVTISAHAISLLLFLYVCVFSMRQMNSLPLSERLPWFWFLAVGAFVATLDLLAQAEIRDFSSPRYFPYLVPAMTLFVGTALTVRFLRQFARSRNMNVELEKRVQTKHAELEANFERVQMLEAARAVAEERERIMREVHDGLGGQLVSTLAMVEGGDASKDEVTNAIRASLDDMRMVINSLDPTINDLTTMLGTLRMRIESRLLRPGLRFEWKVTDLPDLPHFGPHEVLHVLRIVQEAVTNVLKHARASVIRVETGVRVGPAGASRVFVEVRDDGRGLGETANGRGLANMRQRAEAIGAQLSVESAAPGTRVTLWIPLSQE